MLTSKRDLGDNSISFSLFFFQLKLNLYNGIFYVLTKVYYDALVCDN